MNTRLYWTIKNFFQKIVFDTKRLIYVLKEKFSKQCNLLHIQFDILKVVLCQIFLAIVFVLLLKKCDALLLSYLKLDSVSLDMFKDITIGGMGIAGVILGLYCANISSIFSAKYSNVPSDLATLYQRDVITNSCINQIIRYIVVCSIFLFECVFEQPLGIASIIVLLFLTVQMVITFSVTGNRSYMLSDTFSVGDAKFQNLYNIIKKVSKRNIFTTDQSFQNHYKKIASHDVHILFEIGQYNANIPKNQNESIYTIYARINAERKIREILQLMNPNEQKGLIHAVSSKSLLKDLQKIERLSPSYCARYFLAAFICLSDQNLELSALQYYNKALEIAGQLSGKRSDFYAFVYYQLGAFYEKVLGRESGAALFYENAVLKNANCYQATFKNGCYLAQCGKLQEAAESFQKTMTILSKGLKIRELGSPKNAQCLSLKEWQYIYKTNIWLAKIEWNTKGPEHTWYYLTHAKVAEQMYEQNACLTQLLDDKPAAAGGLTRESFLQYHQNSMPVYLLRGTLQRWEEITGMSRYLE